MIPVDQRFLDGDGQGQPGDCVRACVASILELSPDDVPHFAAEPDWLQALVDWCQGQGLRAEWRDRARYPIDGADTLPLHVAVGRSPRGILHAIVADTSTGELLHDPHPSRGMFATPVLAQIVLRRAS